MLGTARSDDGTPIAYEVRGDASPALVFVHGWSCDRGYWKHQLPLAERHRVVTIDLAGHGDSGLDRTDYTIPAFGRDVTAVVDQLGLEQMVLVGHSMGGDVNVEAGLGLGPRVVGQVWVDVYFHLEAPQKESDLEEFLAPFQTDFRASVRNLVGTMFRPGSDPELAGWIVDDMSSAPPKVAMSEAAHSLSNMAPLLEHMPQLTAPIAAINFEWRPTDVESLARRGIRTTLMPGLGHFGMMEDPDRFNQQLEETVESFAVRA